MRRAFLFLFLVALTTAVSAEALAVSIGPPRDSEGRPAQRVIATVTPSLGTPGTRFLVTFRARNEAGRGVDYDIEVAGPAGEHCDDGAVILRHARRGDITRVSLPPRRRAPNWCPGHYEGGVILENRRLGRDNPRFKPVARFTFDVEAEPAPAPRSSPLAG